jgi:hypothetical protein
MCLYMVALLPRRTLARARAGGSSLRGRGASCRPVLSARPPVAPPGCPWIARLHALARAAPASSPPFLGGARARRLRPCPATWTGDAAGPGHLGCRAEGTGRDLGYAGGDAELAAVDPAVERATADMGFLCARHRRPGAPGARPATECVHADFDGRPRPSPRKITPPSAVTSVVRRSASPTGSGTRTRPPSACGTVRSSRRGRAPTVRERTVFTPDPDGRTLHVRRLMGAAGCPRRWT